MSNEYKDYLDDILNSLIKIEQFVEGMTFEDFKVDDKTIFAVIRAFEIIGEASKSVPQAIKDKNSQIPWREMAGMRDKLIHEYFGVDLKVVWDTIKNDIPNIKTDIAKMIDEIEE
ncbi:MAG: DUF86 domain-containing protein [Thermoplasmata archaeon]|nr:MAG: DUF86 domain-containing protein [Thermoplasmata archaeon]